LNKKRKSSQAPVARSCNPGYSGSRDQEDHGSKPAWANSFVRPYLKKTFTKIELVEWLKVKALSSSPSTYKKKEEENFQSTDKRLTMQMDGGREAHLPRHNCLLKHQLT
jgi:hypothetical protein